MIRPLMVTAKKVNRRSARGPERTRLGSPPEQVPGDGLMTPLTAALLGLTVLVAAVTRLTLIAHAPAFVLFGDSQEFYSTGQQLVQTGEFQPPLKRAPLYPLFLAGVGVALGPRLEMATLVQHVLGLGTVLLTYILGALTFGRATGLVAAFGVAINGSLLLMEHTINAEAVFTPVLLGGLVLLFAGLRTGRSMLFLAAGLVLGLGALARPAAQTILPLAFATVAVCAPVRTTALGRSARGRFRWRLTAGALVWLGFVLAVTPWLVRNYRVHGIMSISGGLGDSLVERTRRHDTGFEFQDRSQPNLEDERAAVRARVYELSPEHPGVGRLRRALQAELGLTDVQADAALRDAGMHVIRQQPEYYLQGTLVMFMKVLLGVERPIDEYWERRGNPYYVADRTAVEMLTGLYQDGKVSGVIGVLLLIGAMSTMAAGRGLPLLPLVVATQLLFYVALDGPLPRYRYPMQPLITLVACGGLTFTLSVLFGRLPADWINERFAGLRMAVSLLPGRRKGEPEIIARREV
jgi:4-amino-4-deoxy-L-arabinose transferase-like glycosyltransferase